MLNRYAYCRNNPLLYIDPTGLSLFSFLDSVMDLFDTVVSATVGYLFGGPPGAAIGATTTLALFHTGEGRRIVKNVAEEFFEDVLGLGPELAYMASGITLSAAMDWTLFKLYQSFTKMPNAVINTENKINGKDPKYKAFTDEAGKSGKSAGRSVSDLIQDNQGVAYEILNENSGELVGLYAKDGATTLSSLPNVGINHTAVVIKGLDGNFYNSMTGGNLYGITGVCHQVCNRAIARAGYALSVNSMTSGWFSYVTAAVYGPYGTTAPLSSYAEWNRNP